MIGPKSKLTIPDKASDITQTQIDCFRLLKSAHLKFARFHVHPT